MAHEDDPLLGPQLEPTPQNIAALQRKIANLHIALERRDTIACAKGILMATCRATADEAFAMLTRVSHCTHRKVYDVASEVMLTGALPATPSRARELPPRAVSSRARSGRAHTFAGTRPTCPSTTAADVERTPQP